MTEKERNELGARWQEIHTELDALHDLKVHRTGEPLVDFAARERGLLSELDEIEHALGEEWLREYRQDR